MIMRTYSQKGWGSLSFLNAWCLFIFFFLNLNLIAPLYAAIIYSLPITNLILSQTYSETESPGIRNGSQCLYLPIVGALPSIV